MVEGVADSEVVAAAEPVAAAGRTVVGTHGVGSVGLAAFAVPYQDGAARALASAAGAGVGDGAVPGEDWGPRAVAVVAQSAACDSERPASGWAQARRQHGADRAVLPRHHVRPSWRHEEVRWPAAQVRPLCAARDSERGEATPLG